MRKYHRDNSITKKEYIKYVEKNIPDGARVYPFGTESEKGTDTICALWDLEGKRNPHKKRKR